MSRKQFHYSDGTPFRVGDRVVTPKGCGTIIAYGTWGLTVVGVLLDGDEDCTDFVTSDIRKECPEHHN